MYSKLLIGPCTYPCNTLNLSTGSALTAAHFCQTAECRTTTKVSKKSLPTRTALASLRCPSLRSRSVGTLRRAILGPTRLSRHPCRSTHCAEPPFGLPKGRQIKIKSQNKSQITRQITRQITSYLRALALTGDERCNYRVGLTRSNPPHCYPVRHAALQALLQPPHDPQH